MMKTFFCHGLLSGIRLSTAAKGYERMNEKSSFTERVSDEASMEVLGHTLVRGSP